MPSNKWEEVVDEVLNNLCKNTQADYGYERLVPSETSKAKLALTNAVKELINTKYEADYSKNERCDVCGGMQYDHAPDSHKEAGVREFKANLLKAIGDKDV